MDINFKIDEVRIEKLIKEVMQNYPEYSGPCLQCLYSADHKWGYDDCVYTFHDVEAEEPEEGTDGYVDSHGRVIYVVDYQKLRKGFGIMMEMALKGSFNVYGWDPTDVFKDDWDDWPGDWDSDVVDGLVQCAIFGDVIYG